MTQRERFEAAMRRHFKTSLVTFNWDEDCPWMHYDDDPNGEIVDCDDFWIGWQAALDSLDVKDAAATIGEAEREDEGPCACSLATGSACLLHVEYAKRILNAAKGER